MRDGQSFEGVGVQSLAGVGRTPDAGVAVAGTRQVSGGVPSAIAIRLEGDLLPSGCPGITTISSPSSPFSSVTVIAVSSPPAAGAGPQLASAALAVEPASLATTVLCGAADPVPVPAPVEPVPALTERATAALALLLLVAGLARMRRIR